MAQKCTFSQLSDDHFQRHISTLSLWLFESHFTAESFVISKLYSLKKSNNNMLNGFVTGKNAGNNQMFHFIFYQSY